MSKRKQPGGIRTAQCTHCALALPTTTPEIKQGNISKRTPGEKDMLGHGYTPSYMYDNFLIELLDLFER